MLTVLITVVLAALLLGFAAGWLVARHWRAEYLRLAAVAAVEHEALEHLRARARIGGQAWT